MKKAITILLSLVLTLTMIPASFADTAYAESSIPEIDYGTPGEDYEPGQVIVCVEGGTQALMASGIFSSETTKLANSKKQISAEKFDGETGKISGEKISVEETLIEFDTSESNVDKAAAISEGDEQAVAEAINDGSSKKEEFSLVLVNTNKADITSLIEKLNQLDCVKFAEPNIKCEPTALSVGDATGEPFYDYQWYLDKKGTRTDYDISAEAAYSNENFSEEDEVVVAVMDTGVDYEHPDLEGSMWTAPNGLIEIIGGGEHGINVVDGEDERYPMDSEIGHGTHCASTIASTWNNEEGIAGINPKAKIMACKWFGAGYISDWVEAMDYVLKAKANDVNVVATNNSWGPDFSTQYCGGITEMMADIAGEKGIISCFAAGNSEYDHDKYPNFAYCSPYIVTVGAMQSNGEAADFSEIGKRTVDVFSPGTQVLAATTTQTTVDKANGMPPQYLPWLQASSDSIVYQNFETDSASEITVAANKYSSENSFQGSEPLPVISGDGYGDSISKTVNLSSFNVDDQLSFEISIPSNKLSDASDYYMAFQAGIDGASLYSNNQDSGNKNSGLIFMDYFDDGRWKQLPPNDGLYWVIRDNNWSIFSKPISNDVIEILRLSAENDVVKIRLRMNIEKIEEENITFQFDNFGIGTKPSQYYYADGTSMATPCAAGVVSLIAGTKDQMDSSADALDVIARLKGGVQETGKLDDKCITKGCVQATSAFASDSELNPVPNTVTISGDLATIDGYFFGDSKGTVKIGRNTISAESITFWNNNSITVEIPNGIKYESLEYIVTRADGKQGRNFGVFRLNQDAEGVGYKEISISNEIEYDMGVNTEDLLPVRIAANDDGILALLSDEDDSFNVLQFYSSADGTWEEVDLPLGEYYIGKDEPFASIVGDGHKFYFLAIDDLMITDNGKVYTGVSGTPYIVSYNTTNNSCSRSTQKKVGTLFDNDLALCSALTLGYEGKLYLALGSNRNDGKIYNLNPETGALTDTSKTMGTLSNYFYNSINGECVGAGSYLISGNMQVVAGAQSILERINDSIPGATSLRATYRVSADSWSDMTKTPSILDIVDGGRAFAQNELAAYGALDQGFIMAGPAQNIGKEDMIDTWYFEASSNSYKSLPARVDPERLRAQAGVSYGGRFYVMGNSRSRGNKLFLKYLELEDFGLSVSKPAKISSGGGGGGGTGTGGSGGGSDPAEEEIVMPDVTQIVIPNVDGVSSIDDIYTEIEGLDGLKSGVDYDLEYPDNGNIVGTHTATIVFKGQYAKLGSVDVTYKVVPKGTSVKKLSPKKKSIKIVLNKQTSQTTGYQIKYSLRSDMKSAKTITISKNKTTTKTIKKLKSKKKYYVQVRTYKNVKENKNKVKYCSSWSTIKSVKVK